MNFTPLNLAEEKKKFFFDPNYNPQFIYEQEIPEHILDKYGKTDSSLLEKAKAICANVLKKWGTESAYLQEAEGNTLVESEAVKIIKKYVEECGLGGKVGLRFSATQIPRTKVDKYTLCIRLPVSYREHDIIGALNHEVGTHIFRRINDDLQPWAGKREMFRLSDYLETEEGIAILHGLLPYQDYTIWMPCLRYYACALAETMPFSQVYENLKPYIDDKERRFNVATRVKRGLTDSSRPGGYSKDRVYFLGLVKVCHWLQEHDFAMQELYIGKIALEDQSLVSHVAGQHALLLPPFMREKEYTMQLRSLVKNLHL